MSFLNRIDWDVIVLQEVPTRAWNVIQASQIAESSFYTLHGFSITPLGHRPHGVALLARHGFQLSTAHIIPNVPKPERALAATTIVNDTPVTIASWHAPNAAGEGVKVKMQGYHAISSWLGSRVNQ